MDKIFDERYLTAANATAVSFADMVAVTSLLRLLEPEIYTDSFERVSVKLQTPVGELGIYEMHAPGGGPLEFQLVFFGEGDAPTEEISAFLEEVGGTLRSVEDIKKLIDLLLATFGDELPGVQRERFVALIAERAAGGAR